jgi:hypothetical protein
VVQEVPYFRENAGMARPSGAVTSKVATAEAPNKPIASSLRVTLLFFCTCPRLVP